MHFTDASTLTPPPVPHMPPPPLARPVAVAAPTSRCSKFEAFAWAIAGFVGPILGTVVSFLLTIALVQSAEEYVFAMLLLVVTVPLGYIIGGAGAAAAAHLREDSRPSASDQLSRTVVTLLATPLPLQLLVVF